MKKYLCFVLLFVLIILAVYSSKNSNFLLDKSLAIDYEIIDENTIKISEIDLEIFIEKFDINIYRESSVLERKIIEGYTTKIDDYFVINNIKINVQISVYDGIAVIGSPLILGGF